MSLRFPRRYGIGDIGPNALAWADLFVTDGHIALLDDRNLNLWRRWRRGCCRALCTGESNQDGRRNNDHSSCGADLNSAFVTCPILYSPSLRADGLLWLWNVSIVSVSKMLGQPCRNLCRKTPISGAELPDPV